MNVVNNELYLGTTAGCLIVANKVTMVPTSICQCHVAGDPYVHSIVSLNPAAPPLDSDAESVEGTTPEDIQDTGFKPLIVTIGRGYRDDIGQIMPHHKKKILLNTNNFILTWAAEFWDMGS